MMNAFHEGGWGMYPTLLFGLLALGASCTYAIRPERRLVPLVVSSSLLTLASGALGFVVGFIRSVEGAESIADRSLVVIGAAEAANCVGLALFVVTASLLATTIGGARVARATER
jgi:hypothetical protein